MELSEYKALPDYMESSEVERYCEVLLEEASSEMVSVTLEKLGELSDRQWHTYELPTQELQERLTKWLIRQWVSNEDDYLEAVLKTCYCFGLDKMLFIKALESYDGKAKREFICDLENSPNAAIDPWWSLREGKQ